MTEVSNWARQLADRKLKDRENKQAERDRVLSDRALINSRAMDMWSKFRGAVIECLTELTQAMGGEQVLVLREENGASRERLSLHDPKSGNEIIGMPFHRNSAEMPTLWGEYALVTYGTNNVVWLERKSQQHWATEDLARSIVQKAFEHV